MVHGKIITHAPFHKAKRKYKLSFFVKTYGSNYFQLKTKAWNNYQMYDSVAQIEVKKKYANCQHLYPINHFSI